MSPKEKSSENRLSSKSDWNSSWDHARKSPFAINPRVPSFRDLDDLFRRHLPQGEHLRCLEIGCCPGQYLWYFHDRFGYQPSGLDYLEEGCTELRQRCEDHAFPADVICADMFDFECSALHPPWDVVTSFGLVEHFQDVGPCLQRHIDFVKPGGYIAISIPNHAGWNGSLLNSLDPELYAIHNHMNWHDLRNAIEATGQLEILEGGYFGRIGFWGTSLYRKARKWGRLPYLCMRTPLYAIETAGRLMPNSSLMSPNIAVVARRLAHTP